MSPANPTGEWTGAVKGEAAEWLSAFGAIGVAVNVFAPVVGAWDWDATYVEYWPIVGYGMLVGAIVAFGYARFGRYTAVRQLAFVGFWVNAGFFVLLFFEVMTPEVARNPTWSLGKKPFAEVSPFGGGWSSPLDQVSLGSGVFWMVVSNVVLYTGGAMGESSVPGGAAGFRRRRSF